MIVGHALETPVPLTYCRMAVGCTSVSGVPSCGGKTKARIVRLRSDGPNQSLRGTAVPPPPQPQAPDIVQPSSGGTRARSEDLFATLR